MDVKLITVGGREVTKTKVGLVLVTDDNGVPLSVTYEVEPGMHVTVHAAEPDFQRTLSSLGLDRMEFQVDTMNLQTRAKSELLLPNSHRR